MKHRITATAIALLFGLSMPCAVARKDMAAGTPAVDSGGGHSGGGTPAVGTPAADSPAAGHASGGQSGGGHAGGTTLVAGQANGGPRPREGLARRRWLLPHIAHTRVLTSRATPAPSSHRDSGDRRVRAICSWSPRRIYAPQFFCRTLPGPRLRVRYPPSRLRIWARLFTASATITRCCGDDG